MPSLADLVARQMDHSSHGGMAMPMPNATTNSTMPGMSMGGGGGHGGHDMGGSCKISMLWNWNTIDSCFLAKSWHNTTKGMFAGSVIGVFFLCMAIELVRRMARQYDRRITAANIAAKGPVLGAEPTFVQHLIRSVMYGVQFAAAFLVMLLGMYYNGFILFAIFLGHFFGYLAFGRDTATHQGADTAGKTESGCAC